MIKKLCLVQISLLMGYGVVYAAQMDAPQQVASAVQKRSSDAAYPPAKLQKHEQEPAAGPARPRFPPPKALGVDQGQSLAAQAIMPQEQQQPMAPEPALVAPSAVVDPVQYQAPVLQPNVYFNGEILPVMRDLMIKEEGKIYGAYFQANSEILLKWWAARRYIQEFEKARRDGDIGGILAADRYKTTPKDDVLIVDQAAIKKPEDKARLGTLAESGVRVLVRNKPRQPANGYQSMHFKFMIFFHKDNPELGKLAITGSFNMTNQANGYNWEDIIVLSDPEVIAKYIAQHIELIPYCVPIQSLAQ